MPSIFENLWVKIAAIVLAVLLWFHVATEKVYQNNYNLPLKVVEITGEMALTEAPPDSINVMVTATGKTLLRTDWKKQGLKIIINRSHPGRFKVDITTDNVLLVKADEVELVEVIEPRELTLSCDRIMSQEIPVHSRIILETDYGFAIDNSDSLVPNMVTITGPRRLIDTIESVTTEDYEFEKVRNDFSQVIKLKYPDIYAVKLEPDTIRSYISVYPIRRKDMPDIEIRLMNAPQSSRYTIEPQTIDLLIAGKAESIDSLSRTQVSAMADFVLKTSDNKIPIQVILPPDFNLISQSEDTVQVFESR